MPFFLIIDGIMDIILFLLIKKKYKRQHLLISDIHEKSEPVISQCIIMKMKTRTQTIIKQKLINKTKCNL